MRSLWIGMAAVALVACGGDDGGEAGDGNVDLGGGVSAVVHEVQDPVRPMPGIPDPPDGMRWVAVDIEYVNESDEPRERVLDFGVELVGTDGRGGFYLSPPPDDGPAPPPDVIPAEGTARGWLVFEVAEEAELGSLTLYGAVGDDPASVEL